LDKYLGFYLQGKQTELYNMARGSAQKHIDVDQLKSFLIPVPSKTKQKELVDICVRNMTLYRDLRSQYEELKAYGKGFLFSVLEGATASSSEEEGEEGEEEKEKEEKKEEPVNEIIDLTGEDDEASASASASAEPKHKVVVRKERKFFKKNA
jgi:hypothetical protein